MEKLKSSVIKYQKIIKVFSFILFVVGIYKIAPYFFINKPTLDTIFPFEIMESTSFNTNNYLTFTGKNLQNIIGVYINDIYVSDCWIVSSSEEELMVQIPEHYYSEAQKLAIQVETRINSDITCLSNKAILEILSNDIIEVPSIIGTEPALLSYNENLVQDIIIYGSGFTQNSEIFVNGVGYPTTYDINTQSLNTQIPYANWCSEDTLTLQIIQYYNGYPTPIKSKNFFLETDSQKLNTDNTQYKWTCYSFIAQSLGEFHGLTYTNSLEAFQHNYELGQRLFGIDLRFSSDKILYGNYIYDKDSITPLPSSFNAVQAATEMKLLRFDDICDLLCEYNDVYMYLNLLDVTDIQSFYILCEYIVAYAEQKNSQILSRLIIPIKDEASYRLVLELCPSVSVIYTPDETIFSDYMVTSFIDATKISAVLLPWDKFTPSLGEKLKQLECNLYVSDLKETDEITYVLSNGANGIASGTLPTETWQTLKVDLDAGKIQVPSVSPTKQKNEATLIDYLNTLDNDRYLVIFSAKDDMSSELSSSIQIVMKKLGLLHIPADAFRYSYLAVIDQGVVIYEECDNKFLQYDGLCNNRSIHVESGGYDVGNISSVQIDGKEYSVNLCGLNVVVYDYILERVLDSVCFDLYDKITLTR